MTRLWKLAGLAGFTALLCVLVTSGGVITPSPAHAADCSPANTGTLVVRIIDAYTGGPLTVEGAVVLIQPNPKTFTLDDLVTDTSSQDAHAGTDRDPASGIIRVEDACSTQGTEVYIAALWNLPEYLEDCEIDSRTDSTRLASGETAVMRLEVDCSGVLSPTATPTSTPGAAATIIVSASPLTLSCNGTSIVTVQVRDAVGRSVPSGTAVTITATLGTVSPTSGHVTDANGALTVFFTAPATTEGTAILTAGAGSASGAANIAVNCGATATPTAVNGPTATVAPPPSVGTGVIQPPSTGDGGLAGERRRTVALVIGGATVLATGGMIGVQRRSNLRA